jgi:protein TonB
MAPIFADTRAEEQRRLKSSVSKLIWVSRIVAVLLVHLSLVALLWFAGDWRLLSEQTTLLNIDLIASGSEVLVEAAVDEPIEEDSRTPNQSDAKPVLMPAPLEPEPSSMLPAPPIVALPRADLQTVTQPPVISQAPPKQQPRAAAAALAPAVAPMAAPDVGPKPMSSPKPPYPLSAFKAKQEGRVVLELEVLEDGAIGQVRLAQSSAVESLDQSALDTVKKWKYAPAQKGGIIVKQWIRVSILFEVKTQ